MAEDIFPVLLKPLPIPEADAPYTGLMVWLAMSPRVDTGRVDATVSMMIRPYRYLKDGTVDEAPKGMERTISVGSVLDLKADVTGDKDLIAALDKIISMLRDYLANG